MFPVGLLVPGFYLVLAVVMTWPLLPEIRNSMLGYPNIDALDTIHLRGSLAGSLSAVPLLFPLNFLSLVEGLWGDLSSQAAFFPIGFNLVELAPNLVDHLSASVLVDSLPFPLCDNVWWLLVLAANGWAGHRLGRRIGGREGAGFLVGVAYACSEAILREANMQHAAQAFQPFAPLFLVALLDVLERGNTSSHLRAALWFSLACLTYWYMGLFLAFGSLGLLVSGIAKKGLPSREWWTGSVLGSLLCMALLLPPLSGLLSSGNPVVYMDTPPSLNQGLEELETLPENMRFLTLHGGDPAFPLRSRPLDRSNRLSLVLILVALLGARKLPAWQRFGFWFMVATGAVMVLGPVLKWGEEPLSMSGSPVYLPFYYVASLHPLLARLFWPERWGVLVVLGLVGLSARGPRPGMMAALIFMESWVGSGNLPLARQDLHQLAPWARLRSTHGAVLELPLRRQGLDAALAGLHRRYHLRPQVNPMILPPGAILPGEWEKWKSQQPFIQALERFERGAWPRDLSNGLVDSLLRDGVTVVALDVEPGGTLSSSRQARYKSFLAGILGEPVDYGPFLAWWLDPLEDIPGGLSDGESWRDALRTWTEKHPPRQYETLIKSSEWIKDRNSRGERDINGCPTH